MNSNIRRLNIMLHTSIEQTGDVGLVINVFKLGEMMKDEKHLQSIKTVQVTVYFFSNSVRFCNYFYSLKGQ